MKPFIGREYELSLLQRLLDKNTASLVVIYGRRRIGKSRLVEEFGKSIATQYFSFSGLPPRYNLSLQDQLDDFSKQMSRELKTPRIRYTDWGDAFADLASFTAKKRTIILLDEITWLAKQDPDFLGKLKNAWDMKLKKNNKLILVLCGSVSAWISQHIILSTGFYGRISLKLRLKELPIKTCNAFWHGFSQRIAAQEKLKILAVTGGVPKYLEEINPKLSAEENIKHLCFTESGLLFNDFKQIFSETLLKDSTLYGKIVNALTAQALEQKNLSKILQVKSGGYLSTYLDELTSAGFITRHHSWNINTGKTSLKSCYRLSDNYLRFYLKYILPNTDNIISGNFNNRSLSLLPGWASIMSLQLETLVLNNRNDIHTLLNISPEEIICDNPYYQRPTKNQPGCQVDYMIQTKFNSLYICEIRFSRNIIKKDIITEMQSKIARLKVPKNFSIRPVLIHANEVHDDVIDCDYFSHIINLADLFN